MLAALFLLVATSLPTLAEITLGDALAERTETQVAYPPVRPATRTYSFLLDQEASADIASAVAAIRADGAAARLVQEPIRTGPSAKTVFVQVEAPAAVEPKSLIAALRKSSKRVERLALTAFDIEPKGFMVGVNSLQRRFLESSSEVRWADSWNRSHQVYTLAGTAKTASLASRLAKTLGLEKPPAVARHTIAWKLKTPVDAEAGKRAEKALLALDGVESARLDVSAGALELVVAFAGLDVGGPPYAAALSEQNKSAGTVAADLLIPRARFDTTPVFDVLDAEKLVVLP